MTEEEKKKLEDAAKAAREKADQAHQAVADSPDDEALQTAADTSEEEAVAAQAAVDAAVVTPAPAPKGEEDEEDDTDIDFDKELEKLSGGEPPPEPQGKKLSADEKKKAQRAVFFAAKRLKELGGDPSEAVAKLVEDEDPPAPLPDQSEFVRKEDLAKRDLQSEIRKLSRTEAERKVTEWHAEHSIKPSGDPAKDAENAYLIAHKGRITRSFDEIRRAAGARPTPGAGPGRKPPLPDKKAPELNATEKALMKSRGFRLQPNGTWESKRYVMRFDLTKKGWIEEKKQKT